MLLCRGSIGKEKALLSFGVPLSIVASDTLISSLCCLFSYYVRFIFKELSSPTVLVPVGDKRSPFCDAVLSFSLSSFCSFKIS